MIVLRPRANEDYAYRLSGGMWRQTPTFDIPAERATLYSTSVGAEVLVYPTAQDLVDIAGFQQIMVGGAIIFDAMCMLLRQKYNVDESRLLSEMQAQGAAPVSSEMILINAVLDGHVLTSAGWESRGHAPLSNELGVVFSGLLTCQPDLRVTEYIAAFALAKSVDAFATPNTTYRKALKFLTERGW